MDHSLNLLEHCAEIYARCDDANRRLCNQAIFSAVYVDEDNDIRVGCARPFDALCDAEVQADSLTWAQNARNENEARTPSKGGPLDESSNLVRLG